MQLSNLFLLAGLVLVSCQKPPEPGVTEAQALRQESVDLLREVAEAEAGWAKIHAAEYLLALNYSQDIDSVFLLEEARSASQPYYRIGVWRALAQSTVNEKVRAAWIGKIEGVYMDRSAADRVHAAEAMAKLGVSPQVDLPSDGNPILKVFASWAEAHTSLARKEVTINHFVDAIRSSETPDRERKLSAYALRDLGGLSLQQWNSLVEKALEETNAADWRVYLYSLCWYHAPEDSLASARIADLKSRFINAAENDVVARRELALTLAERGTPSDVTRLSSIVRQHNGDEEGLVLDLQVASAYAILRIERRVEQSLGWFDWTIVILYGALMLGVGWYYSSRNKTREDYLLGGRTMNSVAVGISLFATMLSTLSYLSYPGEMIKYGPVIFAGMLGFPLVYFVVGWWLIPRIMQMNVTSAYEILEIKLGLSVRMLATLMFLLLRFLWMATMIYVTVDVALLSVVPIDRSYVPLISGLLLGVTIIYSSMGGLKAVVVTDVIQSLVFILGALLSIAVVWHELGSFMALFPTEWPSNWKPIQVGFDSQERGTVGNAVLMLFTWYLCTTGSDQMAIQRYLSTRDVQAARKSLKVSLYWNLLAKVLLGILGLAMLAFFSRNPHWLADGQSMRNQADTLFPRFILVGLPLGLSGLVIAGLLSAAMSSLSSGLNSVSTVLLEDVVKRFSLNRRSSTSDDSPKQAKLLTYGTGVVVIFLSLAVSTVQGNLFDIVVRVVNLFVAPLFVLFFMALFVPFASSRGTFWGGIVAVGVAVSIAFFDLGGISVLWIMPMSLVSGIASACLFSVTDNYINKRI